MLSRLRSVLPDGNRKFPLKYMRMVNTILDRMYLAKNRYLLANPIRTPGMELLRFLILNFDIDAMDDYSSDADRYTELVRFYKDTYRSSFDPVFSNTIDGGKFMLPVGGKTPDEIFLNCECNNPLIDLPFDRPWSDWQDLRSIELLYHNSLELPENFYRSMFEFKFDRPEFLLFSLNVTVLLFKYYKYAKDCKNSHQEPDILYFLKEFEYSHFFEDLFDTWIFNLVTHVFENPDAEVDSIISGLTVPMRFCTTNMLRMGIEGLQDYAKLVKQGAMKPQDFMVTKWFREGSLNDRMDYLDRWVLIPQTHKYLWLRCMEWLPYLYLYMVICRLFPETPLMATLETRCKELWELKIKHVNMPAAVINPKYGPHLDHLNDLMQEILTKTT